MDLGGLPALVRARDAIRERDRHYDDKKDRGKGTVCFPEMRRGQVGLCVATQIARYVKPANPLPGWHSPEQAWAQTQGQLSWYRAMEEDGQMRQIKDRHSLRKHVEAATNWLKENWTTARYMSFAA